MTRNRSGLIRYLGTVTSAIALAASVPLAAARSVVPAQTRFMVELRDKLDAQKVERGKKFEARTLEALEAVDGRVIKAGAKLKGRVSHVENDRMILRFEQIETGRGKSPVVATVRGIAGERDVRSEAGAEGELRSAGSRGRSAAIGAAVLGGIGVAAGASRAGGKGAAIGGGAGAATGALIGAAAGGKTLVLHQGTRIEVELDRPLTF